MGRTTRLAILGLVLLSSAEAQAVVCAVAIPGSPFMATNNDGRPMVGASITVTNFAGVGQTVCADSGGVAQFTPTVPSNGIVQFYGAVGNYIVTIAGSGVIRQYALNIPATSAGAGITDINGDMNSSITLAVGTGGADFNIDAPGAGTITFNLPDASSSNRGVVSVTSQSFQGSKTFISNGTYTHGLVINEIGGGTAVVDSFRVETNSLPNAIFVDPVNDSVGINTATPHVLGGTFMVVANTGDTGIVAGADAGETAIGAFGAAGGIGVNALQTGAAGLAFLGQATGDSIVAEFSRSVHNSTKPLMLIYRDFTGIADTMPAIRIQEDNGAAANTQSFQIMGDASATKAYITAEGIFGGMYNSDGPTYGFVGDISSGLGSALGAPIIYDNATAIAIFNTVSISVPTVPVLSGVSASPAFAAISDTNTGLTFASGLVCLMDEGNCLVTADDANGVTIVPISSSASKAVCVTASGVLGVCSTAVDGSGSCTCA